MSRIPFEPSSISKTMADHTEIETFADPIHRYNISSKYLIILYVVICKYMYFVIICFEMLQVLNIK